MIRSTSLVRGVVLSCMLQGIAENGWAQVRTPNSASPAPEVMNLPIEKVGPDDLLGISVYDSPELTRTIRVASDGMIQLPMVKRKVRASGLLPVELEVLIADTLRAEELLVDPVVTVSVVEYRSRPIKVVGAVRHPLTFQAVGQTNLLDALARAEGLAEDAGPEILVSRQQFDAENHPITLTQRIAVKSLIDAADPQLNLSLRGGEEIRVPDAGKIYVVGNVKKPGSFKVTGSVEISVFQVMAMAEGLLPYSAKTAYIYRREAGTGGKHQIPIDLDGILRRKAADVTLLADDILFVPDQTGKRQVMTALERTMPLGAAVASGLIWAVAK